MITYSAKLMAILASDGGVAPVHLLDVMDCNGNKYYWSNSRIAAYPAINAVTTGEDSGAYVTDVDYAPWILSVPSWSFHRSQQTDMGEIQLQYLSGDTLQRDFDRIVRGSALEGAFFVYRYWSAAAEEALREIHGTLRVGDPDANSVRLSCRQLLNPSEDVTPRYTECEICAWRWGSAQCGSTSTSECQHTFSTCQVIERIHVNINSYEKNYGEAAADVSTKVVNRARRF